MNTAEYNLGFDAGRTHTELLKEQYRSLWLQAKEDNHALHKGIRRLNKKIKSLQEQLQQTEEYARVLEPEYLSDETERAKIITYIRKGADIMEAAGHHDLEKFILCATWLANDIERGEHLRAQST